MGLVDLFMPSRQDAAEIFPGLTPLDAMKALRELSPDTPVIVVKCGAAGAIAHQRYASDYLASPSAVERTVDETGAGDAFCGGALVGFSRKLALWEALARAAVSASFAVEGVGSVGAARGVARGARSAGFGGSPTGSRRAPLSRDSAMDHRNRRRSSLDEEKKVMLQEIAMQPDFVRDNVDAMLEATRKALARAPEAQLSASASAIGCGDSYCAALAARSFMMDATERMVEPVEALEFSRYLVGYIPEDAFVFGVSNSGTVSRTIEGVRLARERGAWTFAVTVSAGNRLAETAETLVKVNATPNIKERPDGTRVVTPGTVTYTASMLGLCVAAIALGERVGSVDAARSRALVDQLHQLADGMDEADATLRGRSRRDRRELHAGPQDGDPRRRPELRHRLFRHGEVARGADPALPHLRARGMGARGVFRHRREYRHVHPRCRPAAAGAAALEQAAAAREMGSRVIMIAATDDERGQARRGRLCSRCRPTFRSR